MGQWDALNNEGASQVMGMGDCFSLPFAFNFHHSFIKKKRFKLEQVLWEAFTDYARIVWLKTKKWRTLNSAHEMGPTS